MLGKVEGDFFFFLAQTAIRNCIVLLGMLQEACKMLTCKIVNSSSLLVLFIFQFCSLYWHKSIADVIRKICGF